MGFSKAPPEQLLAPPRGPGGLADSDGGGALKEKVLVLGSYAPSLLNFRGPLLACMVDRGCEVVAAAPGITAEIRDGLTALGVRPLEVSLSRTGLNPIRDLSTLVGLHRVFRTERPDTSLAYTIKPVVFGSLAASWAGVPNVCSMITGLGYAFLGENMKQRLVGVVAKALYRASLRRNQRVLFQNPDDLELFLQNGLLRDRGQAALVNGSGVDLEHFRMEAPVTTPPTFILVARLYAEKGVREYVGAARAVRARHPEARCLLVGAPDTNPSAISESEIRSWVAEGCVEWLGEVKDVRPHLRSSSVLVLPSYREGTPRSVLEAMAMGRPVVTTDAPGCRGTIEDGVSGFLVPVKSVEALAAAMERFIKSPDLIGRMGTESRRRAEEQFDVRRVNAEVLSYLGIGERDVCG